MQLFLLQRASQRALGLVKGVHLQTQVVGKILHSAFEQYRFGRQRI